MEMWDESQNNRNHVLQAHAQFQEEYASLGGKWRFLPLNAQEEVPEGWLEHSFDDRKWERMPIPCGNASVPEGIQRGLYRRSFTLSRQPGSRRILFRFRRCPEAVRLWINGQEIGCASGIAGEAEFEITSAIRPEKNQICMEVSCPEGQQPMVQEDVGLYTLPGRCITDLQVSLQQQRENLVQVRVRTHQADGFTARIALMEGNRVLAHREVPVAEQEAIAAFACPELQLWCPEKPVLYRVAVILWDGIANYHTRELSFGLRAAEIADHVLKVNGQPEKIYALDYSLRDPQTGLLESSLLVLS